MELDECRGSRAEGDSSSRYRQRHRLSFFYFVLPAVRIPWNRAYYAHLGREYGVPITFSRITLGFGLQVRVAETLPILDNSARDVVRRMG